MGVGTISLSVWLAGRSKDASSWVWPKLTEKLYFLPAYSNYVCTEAGWPASRNGAVAVRQNS